MLNWFQHLTQMGFRNLPLPQAGKFGMTAQQPCGMTNKEVFGPYQGQFAYNRQNRTVVLIFNVIHRKFAGRNRTL
jgi:hypothetical protein